MEFIVEHPMFISLADDNLHLREIAAHVRSDSIPMAPVHQSRKYVEDVVRDALRGAGSSERVSHAQRLLLNALKREGYIKER